MPPKKTNIKIKRSKFNLYNKKKSKARRAFKVILTVIVICGLGVLGYGLGKPLLKYIQGRGQNTSQAESETSALISSIMNTGSGGTASGTESGDASSSGAGTNQTPPQTGSEKIYFLPDNATANATSLSNAISNAKKSGCSVVAVTLKDTSGHMLYKTSIAKVKDTDAVTGTLTAEQIVQAISREGLTPAARINTLMDPLGSIYVDGNYTFLAEQGGYCWYDNRADKGGKAWMSPFKTESIKYIGDIAGELSKAGFKHIICVNTRFPAFYTNDITTYLSHLPLKDNAKRVSALWNIISSAVSSAEKNGAEVWVEISGTSLIADNRESTDAELAANREKLKTVRITVNYDISDKQSSNTSNNSNTSNTSGAASDYKTAQSFAIKARTALSGAEFCVRLPQTLTGKAREEVTKAFTEANITVF